jgi:hypothetical protein
MTGQPDGAAVVHQFAVERQRGMKHLVKRVAAGHNGAAARRACEPNAWLGKQTIGGALFLLRVQTAPEVSLPLIRGRHTFSAWPV